MCPITARQFVSYLQSSAIIAQPQRDPEGQDPPAYRHHRDDLVDKMGCGLHHASAGQQRRDLGEIPCALRSWGLDGVLSMER
jgi:hypothetical protein